MAARRWASDDRPGGAACGLQLLRKTEQSSHYLRALLLPEIAAISRPATVITPRLPFQEGSRVQINLHGEERRAVLNRRQASTGSFNQFEYRSAEPVNTPSDKPVTAPVARPPAGRKILTRSGSLCRLPRHLHSPSFRARPDAD